MCQFDGTCVRSEFERMFCIKKMKEKNKNIKFCPTSKNDVELLFKKRKYESSCSEIISQSNMKIRGKVIGEVRIIFTRMKKNYVCKVFGGGKIQKSGWC